MTRKAITCLVRSFFGLKGTVNLLVLILFVLLPLFSFHGQQRGSWDFRQKLKKKICTSSRAIFKSQRSLHCIPVLWPLNLYNGTADQHYTCFHLHLNYSTYDNITFYFTPLLPRSRNFCFKASRLGIRPEAEGHNSRTLAWCADGLGFLKPFKKILRHEPSFRQKSMCWQTSPLQRSSLDENNCRAGGAPSSNPLRLFWV